MILTLCGRRSPSKKPHCISNKLPVERPVLGGQRRGDISRHGQRLHAGGHSDCFIVAENKEWKLCSYSQGVNTNNSKNYTIYLVRKLSVTRGSDLKGMTV